MTTRNKREKGVFSLKQLDDLPDPEPGIPPDPSTNKEPTIEKERGSREAKHDTPSDSETITATEKPKSVSSVVFDSAEAGYVKPPPDAAVLKKPRGNK